MKTEWDYTGLAESYIKRPSYAPAAINAMLKVMGAGPDMTACDVGAGVAHLTLDIASSFASVDAVEPNDDMRNIGVRRTEHLTNVAWYEGTGENTGREDATYDAVTFGSSFNVCDQHRALQETKRILRDGGWFACMWNHRNLEDPVQKEIEEIIKSNIPAFGYGRRREDQTAVLKESGLFSQIIRIEGDVEHFQSYEDIITAWRSHASLERQAGEKFEQIINQISAFLSNLQGDGVHIPYTTRMWVAQLS